MKRTDSAMHRVTTITSKELLPSLRTLWNPCIVLSVAATKDGVETVGNTGNKLQQKLE